MKAAVCGVSLLFYNVGMKNESSSPTVDVGIYIVSAYLYNFKML